MSTRFMSKMKRSIVTASVLTAALVAVAPGAAQADAPTGEAAHVAKLSKFWTAQGVSPSIRGALVARVESGKRVESETPGAKPTSEVTTKTPTLVTTKLTFADGSVAVTTEEVPAKVVQAPTSNAMRTGVVTPQSSSKTGCSGTGYPDYIVYSGCKVQGSNGNVTMSFLVGYYVPRGGYSYLSSKGSSPADSCTFPYGCDTPVNSDYVKQATPSGSAGTTWKMRVTTAVSSDTVFLSMSLTSGGTTKVTFSLD